MLADLSAEVAVAVAIALAVALLVIHSLLLVEIIRQIAQIRTRLEMEDRPTPAALGAATGKPLEALVSSTSLASIERRGVTRTEAVGMLVFLSSDCTTCRAVADGLSEIIERHRHDVPIVAIVDSRQEAGHAKFIGETSLNREEVIEDNGEIAQAVGVNVRPMVVTIREGSVTEAATVRTAIQVGRIAQALTSELAEHGHPEYAY